MGDRTALKTFWLNYSDSPSVETMMLNKNAELIDEQDRRDIWISLPDLSRLRVVELGSGIGRFTTALASVAKHVLATDFVESFIEKNKEINSHLSNVSFKCADAAHLELEAESCDFVFTNWLLMYLTDVEVVGFLEKALLWLTPNGYLHFRESCSESSKRATAKTEDNPTRYRHISQYLTLIENLKVEDSSNGKLMRFEVLWAKSVETYVQVPPEKGVPNWRQIHMLLRKVCTDKSADQNDIEFDPGNLVRVLGQSSIDARNKFDREMASRLSLWGARSPLEPFLLKYLTEYATICERKMALTLFGNDSMAVSPFSIAQALKCNVTNVDTCIQTYDYNLAQANAKGDQRLRFQFLPGFAHEKIAFWKHVQHQPFDFIIGCLSSSSSGNVADTISFLIENLKPGGQIILFEKYEHVKESTLSRNGFSGDIKIQLITKDFNDLLRNALSQIQNNPEMEEVKTQYENWVNDKSIEWCFVSIRLNE